MAHNASRPAKEKAFQKPEHQPVDPAITEAIRTDLKAKFGPYVPRPKSREASNGLFAPGTIANLDSVGKGPRGRFYIGGTACYPTDAWADFIIERITGEVQHAA